MKLPLSGFPPGAPPRPLWLVMLAGAAPGASDVAPGPEGDLELMRRIATRDTAALSALYDRHAGAVFAVCMRMLDRSDAEEVVGDVFYTVWRRPERYDATRGVVLAYLTVLARSRAADRVRTAGRRRKILDETGGDTLRGSLHEAAGAADPFADTADAELRRHVARALAALDARQREAIELSFYGAMSHSEIAKALDQPLGTVKTRIRQGLIRLRESLAAFYGAGGSA